MKNRVRAWLARTHGNSATATLAQACRKYLNAYENIGNWDMTWNGELAAIRQILLHCDGEVLDVGANAGQWAESVLPELGNRRLHSFEPVPAVFAKLADQVGNCSNVLLNNFGLGSANAELHLNFSASADTITSLYPLIYNQNDTEVVTCEIRVGDDYVIDRNISMISILKIDVEGMEFEVLRGFERSFAEKRICAVQFEHGPSHIESGHLLRDFINFFEQREFKVFRVMPQGLRAFSYSYDDESFAGRNFMAVQGELFPD